ncbi:MAG TPA: response regulator transcription factor [Vicinamibacteria bacterium]|nr:response regulator transcription factor [Vicinamibacteria bacterium]
MIRILIVDDHAVVRRGLRELLAETGAVSVGEAATASEALERIQEGWDLLILDLNLPGRGGLDLLVDVKRECPSLPVLILTVYSEDQYAIRALRLGAAGYLTKESAPEQLVEAVTRLVAGGRYVSASLAEKLVVSLHPGHDGAPHEALSNREYQVFRLLASGKTVGQVADELNLSAKTISTYRGRILEKMVMRSNAELTHYAVRNELVD